MPAGDEPGDRRRVRGDSRALHRRRPPSRGRSAARTRAEGAARRAARPAAEHDRVLAVAFPDNQMQVLPYNRVVKDLNGLTPDEFLAGAASSALTVQRRRPPTPPRKGEVAMYLAAQWYTLRPARPPADALDVDVLQIDDPRSRCSASTTCAPTSASTSSAASAARRSSSGWSTRGTSPWRSRCIPVSVDDLMRDRRRRRHHAAEVHLVRAEAARRPAVALDLIARSAR